MRETAFVRTIEHPLGSLSGAGGVVAVAAAGVGEERLQEVYLLRRKAMWRLDHISSESSRGFHADQESMRLLAESIDYSRQAQAMATGLRAPAPPPVGALPIQPVQGVTPATDRATSPVTP